MIPPGRVKARHIAFDGVEALADLHLRLLAFPEVEP